MNGSSWPASRLAALTLAAAAGAVLAAAPPTSAAQASQTFEIQWACPAGGAGCAQLNGGATGRKGSFATQAACEAAIAINSNGTRNNGFPVNTRCVPKAGAAGAAAADGGSLETIIANGFQAMTPPQQMGALAGLAVLGLFNSVEASANRSAEEESARRMAIQARREADEIERLRIQTEERLRRQLRGSTAAQHMRGPGAPGAVDYKPLPGSNAATNTPAAAPAAPPATAEARQFQQTILAGNMANAADLLSDAMRAYGMTPPNGLATGVVQVGAEVMGVDGVLAFKQVDDAYHVELDRPTPLFRGTPVGDITYRAVQKNLETQRLVLMEGDRAVWINDPDRRAWIDRLEAAQRALQDMRDGPSAPTTADILNDMRQSIIRVTTNAISGPGENLDRTVDFLNQIKARCQGRTDKYCLSSEAWIVKKAWREEEERQLQRSPNYPAWRNGEHFMFAYDLTKDWGLGGVAAVAVLGPGWATVKAVYPGPRFVNSPPSVEEVMWGYLGAYAAITGKLDPTARGK
jgi:hypothetical protein